MSRSRTLYQSHHWRGNDVSDSGAEVVTCMVGLSVSQSPLSTTFSCRNDRSTGRWQQGVTNIKISLSVGFCQDLGINRNYNNRSQLPLAFTALELNINPNIKIWFSGWSFSWGWSGRVGCILQGVFLGRTEGSPGGAPAPCWRYWQ